MDNMPDWSGLLPDLLVGIALRLPLMEDFTALKGVCTNWRASGAMKTDLFKGVSKVPLLMLSEKDDSDEREFYSFVKRKILFTMPVPEAKGKRCIYAGFGWILAMSASSCSIGEISLFNPFSSCAKIELPNLETLPGYVTYPTGPDYFFVKRGILSANPSVTSDFTVFLVGHFVMGFWRNGDKSWTSINVRTWGDCGSICYYKRKLFVINIYGYIYVWDPYSDPAKARTIYWNDPPVVSEADHMPYLVESADGELLIILRNNYDWTDLVQGPTQFRMMRVDIEKMECREINGIGKEAVFLGDNTPISVSDNDFPGVKHNCIYFTDDCWERYIGDCNKILYGHDKICGGNDMGIHNVEDYVNLDENDDEVGEGKKIYSVEDYVNLDEKFGGKDMGIYNVEDGTIESFDVESYSNVCPPLWIFPSF